MAPFVHATAVVDAGAVLGEGTRVWHFAHVCEGARVGARCVLGQNVYVGPGVHIGDGVRIQNNVSVYAGVTIEDDVFLGPSCVFTNVIRPRAFLDQKHAFAPTRVGKGATVGANATVLCGHQVGAHALIGAGAVITADVPPHALVFGNPARLRGWVCRCGASLSEAAGDAADASCACGDRYRIEEGRCAPVEAP
jgi:UDP-2-acetamido-3-amino-2,3-dideoxy-glucuronate N-acetyltransferase